MLWLHSRKIHFQIALASLHVCILNSAPPLASVPHWTGASAPAPARTQYFSTASTSLQRKPACFRAPQCSCTEPLGLHRQKHLQYLSSRLRHFEKCVVFLGTYHVFLGSLLMDVQESTVNLIKQITRCNQRNCEVVSSAICNMIRSVTSPLSGENIFKFFEWCVFWISMHAQYKVIMPCYHAKILLVLPLKTHWNDMRDLQWKQALSWRTPPVPNQSEI